MAATEEILDRAAALCDKFEFEAAEELCVKALQFAPNDLNALKMYSSILLELGDPEAANVLLRLVELEPKCEPDVYFSLAELCYGKDSISFFLQGIDAMQNGQVDRRKISSAYNSIAEVYLTDLCEEDDAEEQIAKYLVLAEKADNTNPEVFQSLANFRMSQEKDDEALAYLQKSFDLWKELDTETLPSYEFRMDTGKLFTELGQFPEALDIFEYLLLEDDEDAHLWYLQGWAAFLSDNFATALESLKAAKTLIDKNVEFADMESHCDELIAQIECKKSVRDVSEEESDSAMDLSK